MLFVFFLAIISVISVNGFPATLAYLIFPLTLLIYVAIRFKEILKETRQKAEEVVKITEEKALQTEKQNVILEAKVKERTMDLQKSLEDLKSTQAQLIQQEKLASLGQLTAGIAHEIKNPLNFVNNFSEVSIEMIEEIIDSRLKTQDSRRKTQDTRQKTETEEIEEEILEDIKANLKKIHEHGSRANGIVTSMLQHSRGGTGKKEPTDLNALIKEYVNLSFHGMRAGKNPINLEIQLDLDESIGNINLIGEDFSRVLLNLCNNAFDAMRTTAELRPPKLTIRTKLQPEKVTIEVEDNGPGIPDEIKDKILQPFFTTKKGTEGTGLGLSITHDIVKAHGGELDIQSEPGSTIFKIRLTL
jgi:signal transduction histidine kinase